MNNSSDNKSLSPQVSERIFKIQEQDLVLRAQELELRKAHQQYNFEYAKESLNASIKDQENERQHKIQTKKMNFIFSIFVIVLFIFFVISALFLNKDEIVKEIIKALIYISTSGLGGYYIGKNKFNIDQKSQRS